MIKSLLLPLSIIFVSAYFLTKEVSNIYYYHRMSGHSSAIQNYLIESRFLSFSEKQSQLKGLIKKIKEEIKPRTRPSAQNELGKLSLLLGLEDPDAESKLYTLCNAWSYFQNATALSPRNTSYQLNLADIESLSPYLSKTCSRINLEENVKTIFIKTRLNWIENLAPNDPPALYKKGLIEKALGQRTEAMTSFRRFDESLLKPSDSHQIYFISQVKNEQELKELIPVKFPNTLRWLKNYLISGDLSLDYQAVFEQKLLEVVNILTEDTNLSTDRKLLTEILFQIYWSPEIKDFKNLKHKLTTLLFKYVSLSSPNSFASEFFKTLSIATPTEFNLTKSFSSLSKKSGQAFTWINESEQVPFSVDLRSEGFGIYLPPSNHRTNRILVIQGQRQEFFPPKLTLELWGSNDNSNYTPISTLDKEFSTGLIDSIPTAFLELGSLRHKYVKVFFKYTSDRTYKITGPAFKLVQIYNKG